MSKPIQSSDVSAAVAADVVVTDPLFKKRIRFIKETKPYIPISNSNSKNFELETLNPSTAMNQRSSGVVKTTSQEVGKKQASSGLECFRITFKRIGAGLENLGNTCYLNSVLQCLTYTEPFAAYCHSKEHTSSCRAAGFCAMCALQNHVTIALQASGKIVSPHHIVKNLRCISRNFRTWRQEDAHEYMVNLLESMHKSCLPSGVPTESPSAYERSLVHKIFGGRLRSQVKCMQCSYCSNKFDPFLDLSLEIYRTDSVIKALKHFTAVEQLDGGAKQYQCQSCQEKVRAYKQLTIHNAPYVLTIHLKRFGPTNEKIDKRVSFETTLNLKPFVSDQQEGDLKYTLYGVLVHNGYNTHSGHYYCYVRTSTGVWHRLDDNKVRPVSEKDVLSEKAYMLFYVRDRSSVNKRSADIIGDNKMADLPKRQTTTQPIMNGMLQNAEKKTSITENKPTDTSCRQPLSITVDPKNGDYAPKWNAVSENTVHVLTQDNDLKENDKVASNGLQQTLCHINNDKQDIGHVESIPVPEVDKVTSNDTQCEKDKDKVSLIKVAGAMNTSMEAPVAENVIEKNDTLEKKDRVDKKPKLKNVCKPLQYFGRKQLLFASLSVQKKKLKKCRRQRLISKHVAKDKTDNQVVSTSDSGNPVDAVSSANKEIKTEEVKNIESCKGDSVHDKKFSSGSGSGSNNEAVLISSNQSLIKCSIGAEQDITTFLKNLKQTTVPLWDDVELPSVRVDYMDDERRNKRYPRYDDWDGALDQGKRKKVKKAKDTWNGLYNPFQEAANEQLHRNIKSKVNHGSFGNQPVRI